MYLNHMNDPVNQSSRHVKQSYFRFRSQTNELMSLTRKTFRTIKQGKGWKGNGENKQANTKNMSFILLALKLYYHMSGQ